MLGQHDPQLSRSAKPKTAVRNINDSICSRQIIAAALLCFDSFVLFLGYEIVIMKFQISVTKNGKDSVLKNLEFLIEFIKFLRNS